MESDSRQNRNTHDLSSVGKDLIKGGVVDTQKVYYILKHPNEPKCQLTITAILKKYQEQKRKALAEKRNNDFTETVNRRWDLFADGHVELSQCPKEVIQHLIKETFQPMQVDESTNLSDSISNLPNESEKRMTTIPKSVPSTSNFPIKVKPEPVEVVTISENSNLVRSSSTSSLCKEKVIDDFFVMAEKYKEVLMEEKDVENDTKVLFDDVKKLEADRDQARQTVDRLTQSIQEMNNKLQSLESKLMSIKERKVAIQKEMIAKTVHEENSLTLKKPAPTSCTSIPSSSSTSSSSSSTAKPNVQDEIPSTTQAELTAPTKPRANIIKLNSPKKNWDARRIPNNLNVNYKNDKDERPGRNIPGRPRSRSRSKEKNKSQKIDDRRNRDDKYRWNVNQPNRTCSNNSNNNNNTTNNTSSNNNNRNSREKHRNEKKSEPLPKAAINANQSFKCKVAGCFRPFSNRSLLITHLSTAHKGPINDSFSYCLWGDCNELRRNSQV